MVRFGRGLDGAGSRGSQRILPLTLVLMGIALPVLWITVSRLLPPSDGTVHYFLPKPPGGGLTLVRTFDGAQLRPGDRVVAINGRSLQDVLTRRALQPPVK